MTSSQISELRRLIREKKRLDREEPDLLSSRIVIASLEELEDLLL